LFLIDGRAIITPVKVPQRIRENPMAKKRLAVSLKPKVLLQVNRMRIGEGKLVYVLLADRKLKYPYGGTSVINIGTTKKGLARVASSVAYRAEGILSQRGVRTCSARVITCRRRPKVQTWRKLERATLLSFREKYGNVPKFNSQGKRIAERDEFDYFTRSRILQILRDLAEPPDES